MVGAVGACAEVVMVGVSTADLGDPWLQGFVFGRCRYSDSAHVLVQNSS